MGMTKRRRDEDDDDYEWMIRRCFPFKFARRIFFHGGGLDNSDGLTWIRTHKLGQGSFASVYSAKLRSKSPVVFIDDNGGSCIMPSELAVKSAETSKASSLRSEMEILGVLNSSSYVVRCYGDEITRSGDGKLYYNILLEKCCGGSLGSEVRCYTRDIVRGLCYIHGHGYVHCDIKPDNILLVPTCCNDFRAKIGDFGLAKEAYYDPADEDDKGCCGVRGTFRYMSPELLTDNMQCWLSDIWALGCVVIEMMTGKQVWSCEQFEGSDMRDLLRRIAYSPELPEFPSNISAQGRHFLESCLHRDIDERWSALMLLRHPFLSEDGQRSVTVSNLLMEEGRSEHQVSSFEGPFLSEDGQRSVSNLLMEEGWSEHQVSSFEGPFLSEDGQRSLSNLLMEEGGSEHQVSSFMFLEEQYS
ncbi:hypothetical protein PVL29_009027 [Vitis rotundifolia]|uniref:Protein kinase domain-containing protein n=1 Tax=Vitis rotundifolia TaxID=103349 RepID=A0AA38ZXK1_VITRO|nr:hypothetical protein PVL29_009027 [Vitis rotundifolia]